MPTPRYNQPIPQMRARISSDLGRVGLIWILLAVAFPSQLLGSSVTDTARQLAHKIANDAGPGAFTLEIKNRSSLDDKSTREVRSSLEAELSSQGIRVAKAEQAIGSITIVLSESLSEYVWTSETVIGSDEKRVEIVSLSRPAATVIESPRLAINASLLVAREQPILDAAQIEIPGGGSRLLLLQSAGVEILRPARQTQTGRWETESTLPIAHAHPLPRDLRGRTILRRDHLFDVYLPGVVCRSNATAPVAMTCTQSDDPWPLTSDETGLHAFFAASRNFFTGALSPGIGKLSNVPSFYSAGSLPRSGYTLWVFAAVDGTLHLVDGMTDQSLRNPSGGSDLAVVHSSCGLGSQLIASGAGLERRDTLRAFEIPDREPMQVGAPVEFAGKITALWTDSSGASATAVVKRSDTGAYEAYQVSISCNN